MSRVRCAIYTRKSSEEGLEQDFNSLDAQFEGCAAYVKSQASEGWVLGRERYDDGGISGGTLERPALQRLLQDIAARRIDIVVVYKVDRLTRSLLDFAKLVEAFDKAGTSFVSTTQSFNTTTSMGRLTLNMLLSFAQFEREVTAERIRDKIAASKAKGMWMGGTCPIGYRPEGRSLAIVEEDAALVRGIFARYLELGNIRLLYNELLSDGVLKPTRLSTTGRAHGGAPFNRSELYNLISNRVYVGDIVHKDKHWPGLHSAIIDNETFERAQQLISRHAKGDRSPENAAERSLLPGRVFSNAGDPLIATHTSKKTPSGNRRYRYYVSKHLHLGERDRGGMRIPALELEQVVVSRLIEMLDNPIAASEGNYAIGAIVTNGAVQRTQELAATLRSRRIDHHRPLVRSLIKKVVVSETALSIKVDWRALCSLLKIAPDPSDEDILTIETTARLTRSGRVLRMIQADSSLIRPSVDLTLVRLIVKARDWWQRLQLERGLMVSTIAEQEGVNHSYVTRVLRLAFLSPQIVQAIIDCRQPVWMDSGALCAPDAIASDWEQQKQRLLLGRAA
jgi:DNA invertase Pin-like site-specific DNA recombinase